LTHNSRHRSRKVNVPIGARTIATSAFGFPPGSLPRSQQIFRPKGYESHSVFPNGNHESNDATKDQGKAEVERRAGKIRGSDPSALRLSSRLGQDRADEGARRLTIWLRSPFAFVPNGRTVEKRPPGLVDHYCFAPIAVFDLCCALPSTWICVSCRSVTSDPTIRVKE
jgi:hypothetical protein